MGAYIMHQANTYYMHPTDTYLMHHGVKGMRWGIRRYQRPDGTRTAAGKAQAKINSPEFKRKAVKAAKIAAVIGVAYATHKVANNPAMIKVGKDLLSNVLKNSGGLKASVINSAEFKAASAVGKVAGKAIKKIGSDDFVSTVTGIGAMAGAASVLRSQIKDLKKKPEGDAFDKAVGYTQKVSAIGESMNTLAKGPKRASTSNTSTTSNSSDNGKEHTATLKGGVTVRTTRHMGSEEWRRVREYKQSHPGLDTKSILDEFGWLHPDEVRHGGIKNKNQSKSGNGQLMKDPSTGKTVRTKSPLKLKDLSRIDDYRKSHPNKTLTDALNDLDMLDKEYVKHSSSMIGWRFATRL